MDKDTLTKLVERLKEVNEIIKTLDPAIRENAFEILKSYVKGEKPTTPQEEDTGKEEISGEDTKEAFFKSFEHGTPAENVKLITGYLYSQYGTTQISPKYLKQIADEVGITVPNRIDRTLISAKKGGRNLFQRVGRGKFKPTVHGEQFFKETYQVSKGTKVKETSGEK